MRIGHLARTYGCSVETIRYYERVGLLPPVKRSVNGYREYTISHQKCLGLVLRCRGLGFSQGQVRRLTELACEDGPECERVKAVVLEHLSEVRAKQQELCKMESALKRLARQCDAHGTLPECPVIDELMSE